MGAMTAEPLNMSERIRSHLAETLGLGPDDFISNTVELKVDLDAALLTDKAEYQVPGEYRLYIFEIRALIAMNEFQSDEALGAGVLSIGGAINRTLAKALATQVKLVDVDEKNEKLLHDAGAEDLNATICLGSLIPAAGGEPIRFVDDNDVFPLIIEAGHTLRMDATLAEAMGGNTEYGLELVAVLVRTRDT